MLTSLRDRLHRMLKRLVAIVGHAPHERPADHVERQARSELGYGQVASRGCHATPVDPPASARHPAPSENFLRAYLAGTYDPLASDGGGKSARMRGRCG
jgi:hypothetical protein